MSNAVAASLRLEVDTSSPRNPIRNPSGQLGLFGWYRESASAGQYSVSTTSAPLAASVGENGRSFITNANGGGYAFAPAASVIAGSTTLAWFKAVTSTSSNRSFPVGLRFYDAEGQTISTTPFSTLTVTPVASTYSVSAATPTGAVSARLYMLPNSTGAAVLFGQVAMRSGLASGAAVPAFVPANWVNIISKSTKIETEQGNTLKGVEDELTTGTLVATIRDATIDPATSNVLAKGRPMRLTALVGGARKSVWAGTLATADSDYEDTKVGTSPPVIVVTGTDDAQALSDSVSNYEVSDSLNGQMSHQASVANVSAWDGTSGPLMTPGVVPLARADGSKCTDWITRACNTSGAYAWIDAANRLTYRLVTYLPAAAVATFSDRRADVGALYYTGIGLNFGTRSNTNVLMVRRINVDEGEGNAKDYGPYTAAASADANGRSTATIEITAGSPAAIANAVLPVFATPKIFPTSLRLVIGDDNAATALDLAPYSAVRVKRTSPEYDDVVRVLRIRHEVDVTPDGIKWRATYFIKPLESATAAPVTPPPAGADTGPDDVVPPAPGILGSRYRSANYNMASGSYVTVPLDAADTSDGIAWDVANSRFVIPRDGRYQVNAAFRVGGGAAVRAAKVTVNGETRVEIAVAGAEESVLISRGLKLAEDDVVSLVGLQYVSNPAAVYGGANRNTFMDIAYVGP